MRLSDDEWERRWEERERRHAAELARYRQDHIDIAIRALILKTSLDIIGARIAAEVVIDALIEDGVVFARMGSCDIEECE